MKITLGIIKEIQITHLMKTSIENLTKLEAITQDPKLFWNSGILFSISEYDTDESSIRDRNGVWIIESLHYAFCDELITESSWNGYKVEVNDLSNHSTFSPLFQSLKENNLE
ncbi:MAG: hypothetical protein H8D35_02170 [Nitrosopumilus sp.]|nr:hypothetical protein [Nitrosopumilus sp.]